MYARTTLIQADPGKIDDGVAYVRDEIIPQVTAMDGCIGMSLLVDHETGRCISTTAWESEAAMQNTAERVRPLRDRAEQVLGASSSLVDLWEVGAVHRAHAMPDGAGARVTWLSGPPGTAERAADIFRMVVLPRVQELEGFCSGSLLLNREAGRAVGTITFETMQQVEASREAAVRIRELASKEAGATVDEVAEMEVALAHLHVPEMA